MGGGSVTRAVDFRVVDDQWQSATFELERLAARLPDGDRRWGDFNARMNAAADPEAYLVRRPDIRQGLPVILMEPGPLTRVFLEDLRRAVATLEGVV